MFSAHAAIEAGLLGDVIRSAPHRGRPPSSRALTPVPGTLGALEPRSILVVDDDDVIRDTLRLVLEDEGYRVMTAEHGRDALEKLTGGGPLPSVMLIDLMMPVMDGWKLIAEVKRLPELSSIPVVVISAGGNHLLATAPVASGYLTKPLDLTRLLQTVTRLCGT
jgi:CheY-like chemotaxis protein